MTSARVWEREARRILVNLDREHENFRRGDLDGIGERLSAVEASLETLLTRTPPEEPTEAAHWIKAISDAAARNQRLAEAWLAGARDAFSTLRAQTDARACVGYDSRGAALAWRPRGKEFKA